MYILSECFEQIKGWIFDLLINTKIPSKNVGLSIGTFPYFVNKKINTKVNFHLLQN